MVKKYRDNCGNYEKNMRFLYRGEGLEYNKDKPISKVIVGNIANVLVSVGYNVTQGELIATSTPSKLDESNKSLLHFEVYYKNEAIDPESIYTLNVSQLQ